MRKGASAAQAYRPRDESLGSGVPNHPDRGCELAPRCLTCPQPRCKYDGSPVAPGRTRRDRRWLADVSADRARAVLTAQEYRIWRMVCNGYTNTEIAMDRGLALSTVKVHMQNIYRKLTAESDPQITQIGADKRRGAEK